MFCHAPRPTLSLALLKGVTVMENGALVPIIAYGRYAYHSLSELTILCTLGQVPFSCGLAHEYLLSTTTNSTPEVAARFLYPKGIPKELGQLQKFEKLELQWNKLEGGVMCSTASTHFNFGSDFSFFGTQGRFPRSFETCRIFTSCTCAKTI